MSRAVAERPGLLARHELVTFFTLTCFLTWGWDMLSWALALGPPRILNIGSAIAPTVAAFLILGITSGKPGVLRLLRSYVRWRVGVQWYLVAVIGVAVLIALSMAVVPGVLAHFVAPDRSFIPFYLSSFVSVLFLPPGGPLLEEGGWRGFALPRLQRRYGPLVGTVILGALWSVWHLTLFFGPVAGSNPDASFVSVVIAFLLFTIGEIGLSVIITWILNNCRGSVLMAILAHGAQDTAIPFLTLFPATSQYYEAVGFQGMGLAIVFGIAALIVIVCTRGRLGYDKYLQEAEEDPDLAMAGT
jgi:membrane protease YdiL (CAAX protease family)